MADADRWTFGPSENDEVVLHDGTALPHRRFDVSLNGLVVGELELHMHRRKGKDGRVDVSFGATFITYGPPTGGQ